MGRAPCCEKVGLKRGRWTAEEDEILTKYIQANGEGSWRSLPKNAGLLRCGKSCRLRWINYLRSDLKRGNISSEEEEAIIKLHASLGNKWSLIAGHLPGRTDNEIKNYWNSHLSRKIQSFRSPTDETKPPLTMESSVNKRRGRTSRSAMKRNKMYISTITPKFLEQNKERPFINSVIPMPRTPAPLEEAAKLSAVSWQEEAMGGIILDDCPMENQGAPMLCPNEELDAQILCLNDIMADGEVNTSGSLNLVQDRAKSVMVVNMEERESGNGWYSASSSTNSLIEDGNNIWNWNLDGSFEGNDEEDQMLSWLWDTSDTNGDEGEGDSEKQNAMVAWLLS
ncbi:hypothetical protein LguiA_011329 [Lonicera macranthoides]